MFEGIQATASKALVLLKSYSSKAVGSFTDYFQTPTNNESNISDPIQPRTVGRENANIRRIQKNIEAKRKNNIFESKNIIKKQKENPGYSKKMCHTKSLIRFKSKVIESEDDLRKSQQAFEFFARCSVSNGETMKSLNVEPESGFYGNTTPVLQEIYPTEMLPVKEEQQHIPKDLSPPQIPRKVYKARRYNIT